MSGPPSDQGNSSSSAANIGGWLHFLLHDHDHDHYIGPNVAGRLDEKQKIQSVAPNSSEDAKHYEPLVVSIGPMHHGKDHLQAMEKFKRSLAQKYAERIREADTAAFETVLLKARNCYSHSVHSVYNDPDWFVIMFIDACFILEFLSSELGGSRWVDMNMKNHDRDLVRRDLLLLENQLPFELLQIFCTSFMRGNDFSLMVIIMSFLFNRMITTVSGVSSTDDTLIDIDHFDDYIVNNMPLPRQESERFPQVSHKHLLQLFRDLSIEAIGAGPTKLEEEEEEDDLVYNYPNLSVTELKKAGIRCRCGKVGGRLTYFSPSDIYFKSYALSGKLVLPQLTIHEWTKALLLNLVAYEYSCSTQDNPSGISTYLNFMGKLINREEDVKELRGRGIISYSIGDDQAVVDLFRDITAHVAMNNPQAFKHVKRHISAYLASKRLPLRVFLAEFKQKYFSGPWNIFVFLAVIFTLAMTIIQTIFTAIQTCK
uniref:UPF0481 protein At3g47200-like n=1 Tax=Nicotiana tabacum TaxID=4097 RepID=A0A1S4CI51_TOBAC|nr:PREDICTED: UPF0481 protein At3g47200-like [Nicotiana tabacum]